MKRNNRIVIDTIDLTGVSEEEGPHGVDPIPKRQRPSLEDSQKSFLEIMKNITCESCRGYSAAELSFIGNSTSDHSNFANRYYFICKPCETWNRIYDLFCLMSDTSPAPSIGHHCSCWRQGDPETADMRFRASLARPSRVTADVVPVLLQIAAATEPLPLAEMRAKQDATVIALCAVEIEDRRLNGYERLDLDQLYRLGAGELWTGADLVRFDDDEC